MPANISQTIPPVKITTAGIKLDLKFIKFLLDSSKYFITSITHLF